MFTYQTMMTPLIPEAIAPQQCLAHTIEPCITLTGHCGALCSLQLTHCPGCTLIPITHCLCTYRPTVCPFATCPVYSACIGGTCPLHSACPGHSIVCPGRTLVCPAQTIVCPGGSIVCPGGSIACGGSLTPELTGRVGLQELAVLKQQLQEQLKAVEQQERAMAEASRPATLEEAESLEKQLTQQLEELRAHKASLQRGGTKKER